MKTSRYQSLNFGDEKCASSQYRILAYIAGLKARGIQLIPEAADAFSAWEDLGALDGVIVQKKLLSVGRLNRLRRQARRLIYDIDDAIWLPHGRRHHWWTRWRTNGRLRHVVRSAEVCVAANHVIAAHLAQWARRVEVQPMVLDETAWAPRPRTSTEGEVVLGWSGAPGNLKYLERLEPVLASLQKRYPFLRVRVLCGKKPGWSAVQFDLISWRPGVEAAEVGHFDIGLLPLEMTDFASAKSPIKGLQYMASGICTVATPLPATRELFGGSEGAVFPDRLEDWESAIEGLIRDPMARERRAVSARAHFLARHTLSRGLDFWTRLLTPA